VYPEKLEKLKFLFYVEAIRNHVFPLGGAGSIADSSSKPYLYAGRKKITFYKGQSPHS